MEEKIIAFVGLLLRGDPTDKEYQRKLIDALVYKVYVYDDHLVTYLNIQDEYRNNKPLPVSARCSNSV